MKYIPAYGTGLKCAGSSSARGLNSSSQSRRSRVPVSACCVGYKRPALGGTFYLRDSSHLKGGGSGSGSSGGRLAGAGWRGSMMERSDGGRAE
jgi:hypothetical protein